MRRLMFILLLLLAVPSSASPIQDDMPPVILSAGEESGAGSVEEDFDVTPFIFGHIGDAYEWHITEIKGKEISIPLPCIVIDDGLHVFSSRKMEEHGYTLNADGKLVNAATGARPVDISITKNVLGLIFDSILLVLLILLCARWYKRHDVLKEKPTGLAALLEPLIVMIENDVIKDAVGPEYKKFSPYLLTAFFFILINNLMGIFPVFPGGANITGNIAVTGVMALFTFLMVNLFGNKHYWKDILWPDVPLFLKAIPIMPVIEILGMFTKPFSLMIRLFANMLAGHIMLLSVIALIFLTAALGPVLNGSMTVVAALFGVFLDCLEILVAFLQAYVFTMLSAVFIGLAHPHPETETN